MSIKRRSSLLTILFLAAAGCQPAYDGMDLRVLVGNGDAIGGRITVEQGEAMLVEAVPRSANPFEDYEKFNLVELDSFNQTIVAIYPGDDVNRFVVVGAGLGKASVEVLVDGRSVDELRAEVLPQEVGP